MSEHGKTERFSVIWMAALITWVLWVVLFQVIIGFRQDLTRQGLWEEFLWWHAGLCVLEAVCRSLFAARFPRILETDPRGLLHSLVFCGGAFCVLFFGFMSFLDGPPGGHSSVLGLLFWGGSIAIVFTLVRYLLWLMPRRARVALFLGVLTFLLLWNPLILPRLVRAEPELVHRFSGGNTRAAALREILSRVRPGDSWARVKTQYPMLTRNLTAGPVRYEILTTGEGDDLIREVIIPAAP